MCWNYYLLNTIEESIADALAHFLRLFKRQYNKYPRIIESDNKIATVKPGVSHFLEGLKIKVEP